jgi:hypothetical protein
VQPNITTGVNSVIGVLLSNWPVIHCQELSKSFIHGRVRACKIRVVPSLRHFDVGVRQKIAEKVVFVVESCARFESKDFALRAHVETHPEQAQVVNNWRAWYLELAKYIWLSLG